MSQISDASEIQMTMETPGWQHILAMLDEQAREPEDELYEIMARKPDSLTGKTALKYAIRAKALRDFKESILDRLKILVPTQTKGGL